MIAAIGSHKVGPHSAKLLDVSRSGLGLLVDIPLPVDSWVKVEIKSAIIFGDVRHCTRVEGQGYRVGLATQTVIFRSKETAMDEGAIANEEVLRSGILDLMRWLKQT